VQGGNSKKENGVFEIEILNFGFEKKPRKGNGANIYNENQY
jgi:hypothetical protein